MNPEQFCYWLQGMLETRASGTSLGVPEMDMVREHLKTVFHKKTPEYTLAYPQTPVPFPEFPKGPIC